MVWDALSIVVLAVAVSQPSMDRIIPAMVYAFAQIGYIAATRFIDDGSMFIVGATLSALTMAVIINLKAFPELSVTIHRVCIAEIILNAVGWVMWWNYYELNLYNIGSLLIQMWVIAAMLRRDKADARGDKMDNWSYRLRLVIGASHHVLSGRGKAAHQ